LFDSVSHFNKTLAQLLVITENFLRQVGVGEVSHCCIKVVLLSQILKVSHFTHVLQLGEHRDCFLVAHKVAHDEHQMRIPL